MATNTHHSALATTYAQALLELAGERAGEIGEQFADVRQVLADNPTFAMFMADPGIGHAERSQALERIFKGKIDPLLWNFVGLINSKGRAGSLIEIADAYRDLVEAKLGKVEVDLTVATPISNEQLASAQQKISEALGKEAVVHTYVDESIIGGAIVRVQDKLIDGSVREQLRAMKQKMLAKMPR